MADELRKIASELLERNEVGVVVGYANGSLPRKTTPVFITRPEDSGKLVWNTYCYNNLSVYLTKKLVRKFGKIAVVAKGCDVKAIVVLIQENQIERDQVRIIGVTCEGMSPIAGKPTNFLSKCVNCDVKTPKISDYLVELQERPEQCEVDLTEIEKLDRMSAEERWNFWQEHFARCIKCYACRAACPLCYCAQCIVDKHIPRWVTSSSHTRGNIEWNIVRAMHLAGRCIDCGECTRVCPANIPLNLLNKKMELVVDESFKYRPGESPDVAPWFQTYRERDVAEFFK